MAYNEHWSSCRLALRFNGSDGATTTTDDKGGTVSLVASGGATVALSNEYYDSAPTSLRSFDKDAWGEVTLSGAAELGAGPLTIAATVRPGSLPTDNWYNILFSNLPSAPSNIQLRLFVAGPHWVGLDVQTPFESVFIMAASVITVGALNRIMATRDAGGTWRLFVNGALVGSSAGAAAVIGLQSPFQIGRHGGDNAAEYPAWLDELYIVDGVALETAAFTPAPIFDAPGGGGGAYSPALLLAVDVFATRSLSLPIEVIVSRAITAAPLALSVNVVSPGVLSGAEQVSDGVTTAGRWQPVVMIDGVDRSDDLVGDIQVSAARGSARIATFSIRAEGAIDLPAWTGRRVTVDIAAPGGTSQMRLFTGVVDLPGLDLATRTISLTCTDNLQIVVDAMPRPVLDEMIGGRWSAAVFDPGISTWGYAQDRLSTVPASLDLSPNGALRLTPWAAGDVDFHFGEDMVVDGSVLVSPAERSGMVNHVDVEFGYRFPRAKREAHNVEFSYLDNGFGPWVLAGNGFLFRSAVLAGIDSAGGELVDIEWSALPTSPVLINSGAGGVTPWLPNPVTDPLMCLGFSATVTFDYVQDVDELHKITVSAPASVAAVGLLRETMSGSLVGQAADTLAVETNGRLYQLGLSHIPPVEAPAIVLGQTTAGVLALTADTDRAAADAAIATMVDVAKARIAASHYGTSVSAALALHPLVDLDKTITIEAQGVLATGRVESVEHIMSPDQARAVTQFRLALCRLDGAGVPDIETPTAAPAGVEDGATGPLAPVVCVFNGLVTEDQSFEISFPAVEAAQRDVAEVEITSAFTAALVEDALTIVLED